jgi:hypothetical protein
VIDGAGPVAAGFGIALLIIVYIVVIFGSLAMTIVAVVDVARRPDWQWKLAGRERVTWLLLIILINFLAVPSLIYWLTRKQLIAVQQAAAAGAYGPGYMTSAGWEPAPLYVPQHSGLPVAGWFADPSGHHRFRWWDGIRWTDQTWDDASPTTG